MGHGPNGPPGPVGHGRCFHRNTKQLVQITTTRHRDGPALGRGGPIGGVVMPVPDAPTRTDDYWQECIKIRPTLVRIAARRCAAPVDPDDIVNEALIRGAEFDDLDMSRIEQFLVSTVTRLCADEARRRTVATRMANHPRLVPPTAEDPAEFACDKAEA